MKNSKSLLKKIQMQGATEASTAVYGLVNEERSRPSNAADGSFSTGSNKQSSPFDVMMQEFCGQYQLSRREIEVFEYLQKRIITSDAISQRLGISNNTVRAHLRSLLKRLNVSSKIEVLALFIQFIREQWEH